MLNGTLGDEWHTIVILGASLPNTVPVDGDFHALHMILDVDDHLVILADLDTGTGDHAVGGQDTSFHAIGQNALAVTPNGVGGIRCAHLAGTGIWPKSKQIMGVNVALAPTLGLFTQYISVN